MGHQHHACTRCRVLQAQMESAEARVDDLERRLADADWRRCDVCGEWTPPEDLIHDDDGEVYCAQCACDNAEEWAAEAAIQQRRLFCA